MTDHPEDQKLLRLLPFASVVDCVDVEDVRQTDLIAVSEGRLDAGRSEQVEAHLDRCAYCRQLVEAYRETAPSFERTSSNRWVRVAWVAVAASVTVVVAASLDRPRSSTAYEIADVEGVVEMQMGDAPVDVQRWSVAPTSALRFVLRPKEAVPDDDLAVGVFVETPQGTFRRARARVDRRADGDATIFRVSIDGRSILEGRGVGRRVAAVVARGDDALQELEGVYTLTGGAGRIVDVRWLHVDTVW